MESTKYRVSTKNCHKIFNDVHEEIMKARIKANKLGISDEIDVIFGKLCISAPDAALKAIEKNDNTPEIIFVSKKKKAHSYRVNIENHDIIVIDNLSRKIQNKLWRKSQK